MDLQQAQDFLNSVMPQVVLYVLAGLGALVVLGTAYIKMTPTQDDDQWLQKIEDNKLLGFLLRLFVRFSPIERKEKV